MSILNWFFSDKDVQPLDLNDCQQVKSMATKYGYMMTCPEDAELAQAVSSDPICAKAQQVASKYGYNLTCPE